MDCTYPKDHRKNTESKITESNYCAEDKDCEYIVLNYFDKKANVKNGTGYWVNEQEIKVLENLEFSRFRYDYSLRYYKDSEYQASCLNNQCIDIRFEQPVQEINVTTDKTEYEQEETVYISIENNSNESIQYWNTISPSAKLPFIIQKRVKAENWSGISIPSKCSCVPNCQQGIPIILPLNPKQKIEYSWNQNKDCENEFAGAGEYYIWFNFYTTFNKDNFQDNRIDTFSDIFTIN